MISDRFNIIPLKDLLQIILNQINHSDFVLSIPKTLFFYPSDKDSYRFKRYGQLLETPVGVAAGPHTQMAQNIVAAWLTGARFIELKTVQTLDELEISKPCIDMQDEGYNCEWSQELKIRQSFDQYLNAWIIIHILKHKLGMDTSYAGFIFNMSVGYDYQGIQNENIQWFFNKMHNASTELQHKINEIKDIYPEVLQLTISPCLSDNITLSTMHGCPPEEIEQIGEYLLTEKKLHTAIKLNPTLLGKEQLTQIIKNSGFETQVPDIAFEHDLKYPDALKIIKKLQKTAKENHLEFALKLTNTLESLNNKDVFPKKEKMMYASGKVLHPISVNVARKLQNDFKGELDISFSAGIDALNVQEVINCGMYPVTVCSDILKPGGYGKLAQYLDNISELPQNKKGENCLKQLNQYADKVLKDRKYKKSAFKDPSIKTSRKLNTFDCIQAPCVDTCPTNQGIPDYMYYTAHGEFEKAFEVIQQTNPFPVTTGEVCDHICQTKCTRINYDSPLLIREIKRFVSEQYYQYTNPEACLADTYRSSVKNGKKVAVIGAGPAGLSAAYFLNKAGFETFVFESKEKAGGMVQAAIPKFRISEQAEAIDINQIEEEGVKISYNQKIDKERFNALRKAYDYIFIAVGAQKARAFAIEGADEASVLNPLQFLYDAKEGKKIELGEKVLVIGGGNTAMDAARTAKRLLNGRGEVLIIYRRTRKQMPANYEEIQEVIAEGIEIKELISPVSLLSENGKIKSLLCQRMKLGDKDESGRQKSVIIEGSEFELPADTIIPAVGQDIVIDFMNKYDLKTKANSFETQIPNVFIGGDALNGGVSVIEAVGNGRKAAQEIINRENIEFDTAMRPFKREKQKITDLMSKKTLKIPQVQLKELPLNERNNFKQITQTLSKEEAMQEAARCLLCDEVCNVCTTVCPNTAFHSFEISPFKQKMFKIMPDGSFIEDKIFEIKQNLQILHIADWCNQCGNCDTFCPTSGAPYKEKPHLYLDKKYWQQNDEGYYFDKNENILYYKNNKEIFELSEKEQYYLFENKELSLKIGKNDFVPEKTGIIGEELSLSIVAEMSILLTGAKSFYFGSFQKKYE
ncbi:MAG: putative selenate reductase subunit YgfK [Bacteroidales bacterium]|nr:putative selenate reductase subunit YgfK [Bacteroidales bacterium]